MPTYPIRAVAQMTGLSLDTLRAWERRYEAVVPERGPRGRVYSDADVARLRSLGMLVSRGYSIGAIATLTDGQLTELLGATEAPAFPTRPSADIAPLMAALDRYDREALDALLNQHAMLLKTQDLVFSVVLPLLREVGARWEAGQLRTSQEHLISAIVRSVLGGLLRVAVRGHGPTLMFATPAGERHELGLLCAALLAASAGGHVVYLGPDIPSGDIAFAAARVKADVIVLSVTTPEGVNRDELEALARDLRGFEIWAGGPGASGLIAAFEGKARLIDDLSVFTLALPRSKPYGA